jgi:hypothetical protein
MENDAPCLSMATVLGATTVYQGMLLSGVIGASCDSVALNTSPITLWWWRLHGRGSYRIIFGKNCADEQKNRMMIYFSVEAKKLRIMDLFNYAYSYNDKLHVINVPYRSFALSRNPYTVLVIIGSSGDIVGYEFWTQCNFRYRSYNQYCRMLRFIREVLKGPTSFHPFYIKKRQIMPIKKNEPPIQTNGD